MMSSDSDSYFSDDNYNEEFYLCYEEEEEYRNYEWHKMNWDLDWQQECLLMSYEDFDIVD